MYDRTRTPDAGPISWPTRTRQRQRIILRSPWMNWYNPLPQSRDPLSGRFRCGKPIVFPLVCARHNHQPLGGIFGDPLAEIGHLEGRGLEPLRASFIRLPSIGLDSIKRHWDLLGTLGKIYINCSFDHCRQWGIHFSPEARLQSICICLPTSALASTDCGGYPYSTPRPPPLTLTTVEHPHHLRSLQGHEHAVRGPKEH